MTKNGGLGLPSCFSIASLGTFLAAPLRNAETHNRASLRGGLLRLMMAGFVHAVIGPTSFWLGFVITEIIAGLSTVRKEGLLMVKKAAGEVMAYANRSIKDFIMSWERHLPSGHSPLMSL